MVVKEKIYGHMVTLNIWKNRKWTNGDFEDFFFAKPWFAGPNMILAFICSWTKVRKKTNYYFSVWRARLKPMYIFEHKYSDDILKTSSKLLVKWIAINHGLFLIMSPDKVIREITLTFIKAWSHCHLSLVILFFFELKSTEGRPRSWT